MKTYFRILTFAKPLKGLISIFLPATILAILFNILNFATLIPILEVLFKKGDGDTKFNPPTRMPEFEFSGKYFSEAKDFILGYLTVGEDPAELLFRICILLAISVVIANLFSYLSQFILTIIKTRISKNLRQVTYEKITALNLGYFNAERKGDVMSRMTTDIIEVEGTGVNFFRVLIKETLTIVILFVFLFGISVKLTLFSILILPISGLAIGQITKRLKKKSSQSQDSLGLLLGIIDETLSGMRVILAFNASKFISSKFAKHNSRYTKILFSIDYKRNMASPLNQVLGVFVVAAILYRGGLIVFEGDIEGSTFFTYILLFAQIISPLKAISNAIAGMQRGLVSANRVFEILDTPLTIKDKTAAESILAFNSKIQLKNVGFSYDTEPVLKNIDLTIEKGKTIALVGPSGGGKSTLMDLIPRFHDATRGEVSIDGKNIKDYKIYDLRQLMGVVTQEAILFNDTVYNNIAFGIRATKDEVISAAKIANAHEFIEHLEDGYNTEVGDRGSRLSGGQRQRLTIARAILKNPPILLMDEATSALDSESEHLVQEALTNLMKNRTSLVIAHRFSTIQHADKIVVLKDGEIVEEGTHDELMEITDGVFHKLSAMQSVH